MKKTFGFGELFSSDVAGEQGGVGDDVFGGVWPVEEEAGLVEIAVADVGGDEGGPGDDVSVGSLVEQVAGVGDFAGAAELGDGVVGVGDGGVRGGVWTGKGEG